MSRPEAAGTPKEPHTPLITARFANIEVVDLSGEHSSVLLAITPTEYSAAIISMKRKSYPEEAVVTYPIASYVDFVALWRQFPEADQEELLTKVNHVWEVGVEIGTSLFLPQPGSGVPVIGITKPLLQNDAMNFALGKIWNWQKNYPSTEVVENISGFLVDPSKPSFITVDGDRPDEADQEKRAALYQRLRDTARQIEVEEVMRLAFLPYQSLRGEYPLHTIDQFLLSRKDN